MEIPTETKKIQYTGPEITGDPELDQKITDLRTRRDSLTRESYACQEEIDKIFISRMIPDMKPGDYWRLDMGDDTYQIFRVQSVSRRSYGITIQPDLNVSIYEDSDNPKCRDLEMDTIPNSISISKDQLKCLRKSSRQEFISESRRIFNEIISLSTEVTDKNQLKLNL